MLGKIKKYNNNKFKYLLIKKNYQEDEFAKTLLFVYTFDPQQTCIDKNYNIEMLIYSVLSIYIELPESNIYIYTSKKEELENIFNKYNIPTLSIKEINQKYMTDGSTTFAKIGHSRIYIIPELLDNTNYNLIYMDNDTMVLPGKRNNVLYLLKNVIHPVGFILESHMTVKKWLNMSANINDPNIIEEMCKGYDNYYINNNGIIIYPNNDITKNFAHSKVKIYEYYAKKYGYFYGLDMFIFTLLMYIYKFKILTLNSIIGNSGLLHYYRFKTTFRNNITTSLSRVDNRLLK